MPPTYINGIQTCIVLYCIASFPITTLGTQKYETKIDPLQTNHSFKYCLKYSDIIIVSGLKSKHHELCSELFSTIKSRLSAITPNVILLSDNPEDIDNLLKDKDKLPKDPHHPTAILAIGATKIKAHSSKIQKIELTIACSTYYTENEQTRLIKAKPSAAKTYFIYLNDAQEGPYNIVQIQKMLSAGRITNDTLAWKKGTPAEWAPVSNLLESE